MKRTLPVGMGYVEYSDDLSRPSMAIAIDKNKLNMVALEAKIRELLPESEKYEWQVAVDYVLSTMATRIGLRLRNAHVPRDPKDHIDIYSVHDVYHLELVVSDMMYLKAVVDKLVGSLVRELARIEKEKLKHEHHKHGDVPSKTEWPLPTKHRGSRLVREGPPSSSEVPAKDD